METMNIKTQNPFLYNIISRTEINGKEINFNEFMDIIKIEEDNCN